MSQMVNPKATRQHSWAHGQIAPAIAFTRFSAGEALAALLHKFREDNNTLTFDATFNMRSIVRNK